MRLALERIVAGMDFGMPSIDAAHWATSTFAPGAELLLVHALDAHANRTDVHAVTQRLHEVARGLAPGGAYRVEVREDGAARAILSLATASGADVIVVGPHGGRETTRGIGTTAERLIRTSPVPVLLVARSRPQPLKQILVPIDGGELTRSVVEWADFLAQRDGARLTLMRVHAVDDQRGADTRRDDEWLARISADLSEPSLVTTLTAAGAPGDEILAAANRLDTDLIVMGRRGKQRVLSGVVGSTASDVLRRAPCPVLVVVDRPDALFDEWDATESRDTHEDHLDEST